MHNFEYTTIIKKMQYELFKKKKYMLQRAIAKVVRRLRGENALIYYDERGLSSVTLLAIEKAQSDPKISTLYKIANALELTFPEFVNLVEKELPKGFSMVEE